MAVMDHPNPLKSAVPWWAIGFVWDVFISIALPTVVFALGGRWLDNRWHTSPWFTLIGLTVSLVAVWFLIRHQAKRLQEIVKKSCH